MTLDKFRDIYREAVDELPAPSMDAEDVRDELGHRRRMRQRRRYLAARGCAAAAVFLLCGVGTAAAKNYRTSLIRVKEDGVIITGGQDEEALGKSRRLSEERSENASFFKMGGVFPIEEEIPEGVMALSDAPMEMKKMRDSGEAWQRKEADECEVYFIENDIREYDSIEKFRETEDVVAVAVDQSLFMEEFTWENVVVVDGGRSVMITLSNDEAFFSLHQQDNRDAVSYSTGISYGGQCSNKRNFTNRQGLSYVLFDSLDEDGQVVSVHGVISVNGWDLSVTFENFGEGVAERVLDLLDLSVYF